MLAVLEHVESDKLLRVIAEIHRVLRPDGIYVLTTPAQWTDPILIVLSRLRLLSPDEVEKHQETHRTVTRGRSLTRREDPLRALPRW